MINNHAAYKYETPHKGPFTIMRCFTSGTVNLQYDPTKIRYNIRWIKIYKSDTNVEDLNPEKMYDQVNILSSVLYFSIILNIGKYIYS